MKIHYIFFINDHIYPETATAEGETEEDCHKNFARTWKPYNPKILDWTLLEELEDESESISETWTA